MSLSRRMWSVASDAVQMSSKIKTDVFTEFGNTGAGTALVALVKAPSAQWEPVLDQTGLKNEK